MSITAEAKRKKKPQSESLEPSVCCFFFGLLYEKEILQGKLPFDDLKFRNCILECNEIASIYFTFSRGKGRKRRKGGKE